MNQASCQRSGSGSAVAAAGPSPLSLVIRRRPEFSSSLSPSSPRQGDDDSNFVVATEAGIQSLQLRHPGVGRDPVPHFYLRRPRESGDPVPLLLYSIASARALEIKRSTAKGKELGPAFAGTTELAGAGSGLRRDDGRRGGARAKKRKTELRRTREHEHQHESTKNTKKDNRL